MTDTKMTEKKKREYQEQKPAMPPTPRQDWVRTLVMMVKDLKLNEVAQIANPVRAIILKNDQRMAEKFCLFLKRIYTDHQLNPDPYLSREKNLESEIVLGSTLEGKPLGIPLIDLTRHLFTSGQSGSGKSVFLENIIFQLIEQQIPVVHFDRKGDLVYAVSKGIDSIHWEHLRKNFLCPPDNQVSPLEWRNSHVAAFSELMQFYQRGMSIYLQGVHTLYKRFNVYENWHKWNWQTIRFPTMKDLLAIFKDPIFAREIKGQGKESLLSIVDKLESICIELDPVISCQRGFDISRIIKEKKCVSYMLDGVAVEYQNFLIISELLSFYHYFKVHGPRNRLNCVFVFDEAKGLFGKQNEKAFIIKDIVSKVREFGIAIVCADQVPSEISQFLFSNIGTLVFFRHSDGNDLRRLQYSAGASSDQILSTYALQPGEAIVRTQRLKDLHRIKTKFEPVEKFIPKEEAELMMLPRLADYYTDVISDSFVSSGTSLAVEEIKTGNSQRVQVKPDLSAEEQAFLEELANDYNRPSTEIGKTLNMNSARAHRIKRRLLAKKCITEIETNLGKDGKRALFLLPNPEAFEGLGIELKQGSGRGGLLHRYFQQEFAKDARELGWKAEIEAGFEKGEGADVGLAKDGFRIAVEISITSKPQTEARNVAKNLGLGFDKVVICFLTRSAMEKTKELLGRNDNADKAVLCLANEFQRTLERL